MEIKEIVKRDEVRRAEEKSYHAKIKSISQAINPLDPQIEDNNPIKNAINMPRRDANLLFVSSAQSSPRHNQQMNCPLPSEQALHTYPPKVVRDEEKRSLLEHDNKQWVDINRAVYSDIFAKPLANLQNQSIVSASPRVLTSEPKLEYIKNFFKPFVIGDTNKEYEDYLKAYNNEFEFQLKSGKKERPENVLSVPLNKDSILAIFEKNREPRVKLVDPSPFCRGVKKIIMKFEKHYMEYEEPWFRGWLWNECHEVLFFLKYICKRSAELKNDMYLLAAIHHVKDFFNEAILPSVYHKLKNNLDEFNKKRCGREYSPVFSAQVEGNLMAEKERLENENTQMKANYESLLRNIDEKVKQEVSQILHVTKAGIRAEFMEEFKKELSIELRKEIKEELRTELTEELRTEFLEQKNNAEQRKRSKSL